MRTGIKKGKQHEDKAELALDCLDQLALVLGYVFFDEKNNKY